jgi:hypothetical protein
MPTIEESDEGPFSRVTIAFNLARCHRLADTTFNETYHWPRRYAICNLRVSPLPANRGSITRRSRIRIRSNRAPNQRENRAIAGFAACLLCLLLFLAVTVVPAFCYQARPALASGLPSKGKYAAASDERADKYEKTAYDYNLPGADGKNVPLSTFKGKDILIVNLARGSSYNTQLAALIKLSATYKDKGLIVVGVPSNDFGSSEPGTEVEIQKAYAEAKVNFPVMAVSKLTGDEEIPL